MQRKTKMQPTMKRKLNALLKYYKTTCTKYKHTKPIQALDVNPNTNSRMFESYIALNVGAQLKKGRTVAQSNQKGGGGGGWVGWL